MKIYIASSWKNKKLDEVVRVLRAAGHDVYDFREGDGAFHWSDVDPNYKGWTRAREFRDALKHPLAVKGFERDYSKMCGADACVLVLPSGRSSHSEAGWFAGRRIPVFVLLDGDQLEPELMYRMFKSVRIHITEIVGDLNDYANGK